MELQNIIGSNLLGFRSRLGLTQDQIAEFLEVDRSLIAHYEKGTREVSYVQLKKLSNLFNIDVEDLLEENSALRELNFAFAFRADGLEATDLKSISEFQRVVRNYIEMSKMKHE
ncbi:helix-turn-helix transcriptional regulator [uncultured Algoriphagus sp.]|uniref:helix-turn-helix domain-containing protein n=1 Tax=uncultured Algoriphagus sp. TaxID=417365 RepID=UPI0030EC78F6|tara:strand:+ start:4740 stop:5081 length:342 start_codon:yes stop_codon:yes gene_type:complete